MQTTTTTTIEGKTLTNARTSDVFNRQTDRLYLYLNEMSITSEVT